MEVLLRLECGVVTERAAGLGEAQVEEAKEIRKRRIRRCRGAGERLIAVRPGHARNRRGISIG